MIRIQAYVKIMLLFLWKIKHNSTNQSNEDDLL